ncbi:Endonuclease/exonuclease/phosphatase [Corchorus olitorius]|uniref:Endonuclease/exonuclease/phosphatase n=1 Tax=Corchorus olitorius TaxID=93759 RepID=A0A1R3KU16_9ROSI|nr:Endonuclease/exonuclease/phosphatase [Corchorus olitorius]
MSPEPRKDTFFYGNKDMLKLSNQSNPVVLSSSRQNNYQIFPHNLIRVIIHGIVRQQDKRDCLLTAVYASPVPDLRQRLWDHLVSFSTDLSLPWLMFGDFNDISSINEKFVGSVPSLSRCLRFSNMMDVCAMVDLAFEGPAYTWTNMRKSLALKTCNREVFGNVKENKKKLRARILGEIKAQPFLVGCPSINEVHVAPLNASITMHEVRDALFQMKPNKAPGVDALMAGFYQQLCLVVLVPKTASPYELLSPTQASFIPGRQAKDNMMVAQELIHCIRRSTSKNALMAVKIDKEPFIWRSYNLPTGYYDDCDE